jgi:hypothetical protein
MSDNSDWLKDPKNNPDDDSGNDELLPWQKKDAPQGGTPKEQSTGVTGELSWLEDTDKPTTSSGQARTGVTGDLSWLEDTDKPTTSSGQARTGVTGDLSWLGDANAPTTGGPQGRTGVTGELSWLGGTPSDASSGDELIDSFTQEVSQQRQRQYDELAPTADDMATSDDAAAADDMPDWLRASAPASAPSATPAPQDDEADAGLPSLFGDDDFAAPIKQPTAGGFDWNNVNYDNATTAMNTDDIAAADDAGDDAGNGIDWLRASAPDGVAAPASTDDADDMAWLQASAPSAAPAVPQPAADDSLDFLNAFESAQPAADDGIANDDDFLSAFDAMPTVPAAPSAPQRAAQPPAAEQNWFTQSDDNASADSADSSWLSELNDFGDQDTLARLTEEAGTAAPADSDFLSELGIGDEPPVPATATAKPAAEFGDLDALLASYGDEPPTPQRSARMDDNNDVDLDALFANAAASTPSAAAPAAGGLAPGEDWLSELGASVGQVSASAMVRQRKDRPLDDLSGRLQALRDKGLELPTTAPSVSSSATDKLLSGLNETLAPVPAQAGLPSLVSGGDAQLTPAQQAQVKLLQTLIGADAVRQAAEAAAAARSRVDATYDKSSAFDDDLPAPAATPAAKAPAPAKAPSSARGRFAPRFDRLLIVVALVAIMLLPFLGILQLGTLPPPNFATNSPAQQAYDTIRTLRPDSPVLVAIEYGGASVGELDPMASALLRHLAQRRAQVVVVSRNPTGLLRAQTLTTQAGLADAVLVRYLPNDPVALRLLAQDPAAQLALDVRGQPTGLTITSLDQFQLMVVVAERAEDVRAWAEQVASTTTTRMIAATGYAAGPLSVPYNGALVGAGDAFTYAALLDAQPVNTLPPPTETALPTLPPSATPLNSPMPTTPATPAPLGFAVVGGDSSINLREGAGRGFAVAGVVQRGQRVAVLAVSPDGVWVQVQTEAGLIGWALLDLVQVEATPTPTITPTFMPTLTRTPLPTNTPPATLTPEISPTPTLVPVVTGDTPANQWYAVTGGLLVVFSVITFGTVGSMIAALLRRRKKS